MGALCISTHDAEVETIARRVLDELRRRNALLRDPPIPLQVCMVDAPHFLIWGVQKVSGFAAPSRDRSPIWIAAQYPRWRQTLPHELLCALAYQSQLRGWPWREVDVVRHPAYVEIMLLFK